MQQIKKCAELFTVCFPMMTVSENVIMRKLEGTKLFPRYAGNRLYAFASVSENSLLVICVHPDFRSRGTGSSLLREAEDYIAGNGYSSVLLGRSSRELFYGAVIDTMSHRFFESRGYSAANGCLSMYLTAEDFSYSDFLTDHPVTDGVVYRVSGDCGEIRSMVAAVEPNWLRYCDSYKDRVIITAELSGRKIGFVLADDNAETIITEDGFRTGLLGYAGVLPEYRRKGTGLGMIAFAADYLIRQGCTDVFINYTSLDEWYSGAGFEEYLWYWMGEKKL